MLPVLKSSKSSSKLHLPNIRIFFSLYTIFRPPHSTVFEPSPDFNKLPTTSQTEATMSTPSKSITPKISDVEFLLTALQPTSNKPDWNAISKATGINTAGAA